MHAFPEELPAALAANPGVGPVCSHTTGWLRRTTERHDVVAIAADVLRSLGHDVERREGWLLHRASGLLVLPQIVAERVDSGGVQTVTTTQVHHPRLCPEGAFEYQHSTGFDLANAIADGFSQWARTDLVTLIQAERERPEGLTYMDLEFPAKEERPAPTRRAVLGPVAHYRQRDVAPPKGEEHPFCPCCLLTNSFDAFQGFLERDGFFALRLFALRDTDGSPQADCRVNGEDFEPGAQALRRYVRTWPEAGFEFRKQYVVLRTVAGRSDA